MRQEVDILIAGGGLVGAALAAALADTGYLVAIVDQTIPQTEVVEQTDSRLYAISPRSRRFLTQNGVWSALESARIGAIRKMVIAEQGKVETELHFDAVEVDSDELAAMVEGQCLQAALWAKLAASPNISCLVPHAIQSINVNATYVEVMLDNQHIIHAKLLVGADGARSLIRQKVGGKIKSHAYLQQGIVANFHCEKPHGDIAYQWFCPDGILAWLPLPDNKMSMVWSANDVLAEELMALPIDQLTQKVSHRGNHVLGELTMIGRPLTFPLHLTHVPHWVSQRVALVGDAAHTVHPLAGQGVNLGFGDVEVLARLLKNTVNDPGQRRILRQYERERREAVYVMQGVTHTLQVLFTHQHPLLASLRQFGLRCTNRMGFIKRRLIQAALT